MNSVRNWTGRNPKNILSPGKQGYEREMVSKTKAAKAKQNKIKAPVHVFTVKNQVIKLVRVRQQVV